MDRWSPSPFSICLLALVLSATGCSESGGADVSTDERESNDLKQDEEVTVLARTGDMVLVQTANGEKGFVRSDRLRIEADSGVLTEASSLDLQTPRPVKAIDRERDDLSSLFLSEDGRHEFLRPKRSAPFYDQASGQACWPAYTCTSQDCPGLDAGNDRAAFPGVLSHIQVSSDGTVKTGGGSPTPLTCLACGAQESIRPFVLPETSARERALAEEHRRRLAWERANR